MVNSHKCTSTNDQKINKNRKECEALSITHICIHEVFLFTCVKYCVAENSQAHMHWFPSSNTIQNALWPSGEVLSIGFE